MASDMCENCERLSYCNYPCTEFVEKIIEAKQKEEKMQTKNSYKETGNLEYGEISMLSILNIAAYNWIHLSENEKEEYAFKLGGAKGYSEIRALLDNWKFSEEFEKGMADTYNLK